MSLQLAKDEKSGTLLGGFAPATSLSLSLSIGLIAYATVLIKGAGALRDGDVYTHIVAGRWILAHAAVPHQDLFSGSMAGALWVAHEWLSEVAIALTFDHFRWSGLIIAAGVLFAITLALLGRALLRNIAPVYVLLGCALAWGLCFPHLIMRPHLFSYPLLVIWTAGLVAARQRDRGPSPLWALVMVPWANLHGSFMAGLVIAVLLGGEALFEAESRPAFVAAAKGWGLFLALSLLAALATPNFVRGLEFPFDLLRMNFAMSWISEWQSPDFQLVQPVELWILLILLAAFYRGFRLPVTRIIMILLLLHEALQHQRQSEILGPVSALLAAPALAAQLPKMNFEFARGANRALIPALFGCVLLFALGMTFATSRIKTRSDEFTPAAAVAAAKAANLRGPVFNSYAFGGYLIFAGIPPFIDGRADIYGDDFVRRYADVAQLPALLAQYKITWALLTSTDPHIALLDHLPGWRRIYGDKIAVLYVRQGGP